jgi:allantoinase
VVTPEGLRPAAVHLQRGKIARVAPPDKIPDGAEKLDCDDAVVMPGIVDSHVHVNEPGRTDWEGFASASRAAAAGGVTTLVDMPLNSSPVTTRREALELKLDAVRRQSLVDVGFWGGLVPGQTPEELADLLAAGVLGFKAFLVPSGIDEFPNVSESDLRLAMPELARRGAVLLVHAELPGPIEAAAGVWDHDPSGLREYGRYLRSRPDAAEVEAIALVIRLCRETGCRIHIVHLSSAEALPLLRDARAEGLPVTVETCPHYLTFAAEEIPDGAVEFKCAPPIRSRENRERLWEALREGLIALIATDHSPCPPALKGIEAGDFRSAWGGVASLQLSLPAVWTAARERGFTVTDLAAWMCEGPAHLAGVEDRKGRIAPGYDADLVVWDPDAKFRVDPEKLHHRHPLTPYAGRTLAGVVRRTILRGETIYDEGAFPSVRTGRPILREPND